MKIVLDPPAPVDLKIQTRRGREVYRQMDVKKGTSDLQYLPLSTSVIELVYDSKVLATLTINLNLPEKGLLKYVGPKIEDGGSDSVGPKKEDTNNLQPVGDGKRPDGKTIPRPVLVPPPSVDKGNA